MRKPLTSLLDGLAKTRRAISEGLKHALGRGSGLDEAALEEIEETLIAADVGVGTSLFLVESLRGRKGEFSSGDGADAVARALSAEVCRILEGAASERTASPGGSPDVVMVVGVNGVGKTTTIGKLAHLHGSRGRKVLLAAADTFRAAAGEQLAIWAERSGADIVGGTAGGDAASVAYDALDAAVARASDVLIVDTAGRLHTQKNLLSEVEKIKRVLAKRLPGAPHEVILVLDANTGQNAVQQARLFNESLGVTGIALAKLDGTARGGIVVAIARELGIPVKYVGVGEGLEDLREFEPRAFAEALTGGGP
ncbi:MAG: signal recognition particle-docking protein FtsY [Candidatus Eisenbacteria bacterium]